MRNKFYIPAVCVALAIVPNTAFSASMSVPAPQQTLLVHVAADASMEGQKKFIGDMSARGIGFLKAENLTTEQRADEFRKLLNSSFDMATIGRFALGRYWKVATPAQQAEYQKLFKEMIVKTYSRRFSDYKGQEMQVTGSKADENGDAIVSSSILQPDGQKIQVEWRVRGKNGGYKVVDIMVEGVSMALTQRSDFASVIQRGGGNVDVLIDSLRQQ